MARKTKEFSAFGVKYKTTQFSAVRGMELMNIESNIHPCEMLAESFVKVAGAWLPLSSEENINLHVLDVAHVVAPMMALNGLSSLVAQFNFEFVAAWKGAKVPRRFMDQTASVSSGNIDPLIQQLIQDGVATLKELEEYYSLEDSFKLFDSIMVKGINQAISQEAAMNKPRR